MLTKSDLLIIVPALNEEASISRVIAPLRAEAFNVLVVNDGSTDATSKIARNHGVEEHFVRDFR